MPMNSHPGIPDGWLRKIRASISRKMYRKGTQDNRFITRKCLLDVWLDEVDGSCPLDEFQSYVGDFSQRDIVDHLLHIISILVFVFWDDWSSFADRFGFESDKFTDQDLPLSPQMCERVFFHSPEYDTDFYQAQYAFLPVSIEQHKYLTFRDPNWRLPLTFEGQPNETGSYGTVTQVTIAEDYFLKADGTAHNGVSVDAADAMKWDAYSCQELTAARKLFPIQPNYEREVRNLTILRSGVLNHDRIMEHLGSVIIGREFNIFFQWADLNLEEFFDDEQRPSTIRKEMITPSNLLKESTWLASALEYLHTQLLDKDGKAVHCCHMDLKPDNILVMLGDPAFPLGKWKIADFGISNIEPRSMSVSIRDFYSRTTTSSRPQTIPAAIRSLRYPGHFQPPEAESSEQARYTTKKDFNDLKGDIWSFGCILLVVLVFATGGTPYVDELANRRQVGEVDFDGEDRTGRFYRRVTGPPQIMPSIVTWITPLARTQAPWFQEAWSFISNHMLKADPTERIGAEVVRHRLAELRDKSGRRNIWAEAPDPQSFHLSPATVGPSQPSTTTSNWTMHVAQSQLQTGRNLNSQNFRRVPVPSTVSPILEHPEPVMTPTHSEGLIAIMNQDPNQGYSPASETTSHRSSTSNRSGSSGLIENLSQALSKEKNLVMSSDGQKIAFWNQYTAKIFSKRSDDHALFSKEIVQNIESRHNSMWEQIYFAGPVIALRDRETLNIFSRNLVTEPDLQNWGTKVRTQDVVGFDVSPRGAIAFRFPRAVKVFTSRDCDRPDVDCAIEKENIKAVAFSRTGDVFIAVSDTLWFLWKFTESSKFRLAMHGEHEFSRPEHGKFEPCIIPFNTAPIFLLWDKAYRERISIITKNYNTPRTVPADTRAVTVSCDDQNLVLLIVKMPLVVLRRHKYFINWTGIVADQTNRLTTGQEYQKLELGFKANTELPLNMVTLSENGTDVALVALSDGQIERVVLNKNGY